VKNTHGIDKTQDLGLISSEHLHGICPKSLKSTGIHLVFIPDSFIIHPPLSRLMGLLIYFDFTINNMFKTFIGAP